MGCIQVMFKRVQIFSILISAFLIQSHVDALAQAAHFDESRAWDNLIAQCSFGPRTPGSKAHAQCLDYLEDELQNYAESVQRQTFLGVNPKTGDTHSLVNLVAKFWPAHSRRVMLCAHWDTRPWADQDRLTVNHNKPVLGANDGASGVAVLLEISRCIGLNDPGIGVDIVLFDGEDMGREGRLDEYCQGSRWYAQNLEIPLPEAVVLLDMVGDADLHIPQELYSRMSAPELLNEIYLLAEEMGESCFDTGPGTPVYDDHVPLLQEGIPAINLIDFEYQYWHTIEDIPDNCSAESLGKVGRVVLEWIYRCGKKR